MRESTKDRFMREAATEACYAHNGGVEILEVEPRILKENEACSPCGECTMRELAIEEINRELELSVDDRNYWYHQGWLAGVRHQKRIMAELDRRMD